MATYGGRSSSPSPWSPTSGADSVSSQGLLVMPFSCKPPIVCGPVVRSDPHIANMTIYEVGSLAARHPHLTVPRYAVDTIAIKPRGTRSIAALPDHGKCLGLTAKRSGSKSRTGHPMSRAAPPVEWMWAYQEPDPRVQQRPRTRLCQVVQRALGPQRPRSCPSPKCAHGRA